MHRAVKAGGRAGDSSVSGSGSVGVDRIRTDIHDMRDRRFRQTPPTMRPDDAHVVREHPDVLARRAGGDGDEGIVRPQQADAKSF